MRSGWVSKHHGQNTTTITINYQLCMLGLDFGADSLNSF